MILHFWRDRSNRISRTWEEYKDNRYFELKLQYFYKLDRNKKRPLVLWGAGRNGKDLAQGLQNYEADFYWVCDNERKIGKDIYGLRMYHYEIVKQLNQPQIIIAVSAPDGKKEIQNLLDDWNKNPVKDYWFFS